MPVVFTIGHSTRPIGTLLRLLAAHDIRHLVDVRTIPKSRRNPHYAQHALRTSLEEAGIRYTHMPELGGLRHPRKDSPNQGWTHSGFRGFADYMQTPAFASALDRLIDLAAQDRLTIMCAEAVPWRCHRSLIADALIVRGVDTREIASGRRAVPHKLTSFARIEGTTIVYPG